MPSILGVGTASIVFVFMLLALVTFAVLTYTSAAMDFRLSQKSADRTEEYYEASNRAQKHIGDVDDLLKETYAQTSSSAVYMNTVENTVGEMSWAKEAQLKSKQDDGKLSVSWEEQIDEGQCLAILLEISPPQTGESFYKIRRYKVADLGEWNVDKSVNVFRTDDAEENKE